MLGVLPSVGAAALAAFLVVSTVVMHDFWNQVGEDAADEMTAFLKNLLGAGGALVFLALAGVPWPYAVDRGL